MGSVQGELDKRLEPEIRRFLKGFARQALERSIRAMLEKGGLEKGGPCGPTT